MSARGFWIAAAATVAMTIGLELAFRHLIHAEFFWQRIPSFDLVYGLVGCAAIVFVSKWLGQAFLQREESYYEKDER